MDSLSTSPAVQNVLVPPMNQILQKAGKLLFLLNTNQGKEIDFLGFIFPPTKCHSLTFGGRESSSLIRDKINYCKQMLGMAGLATCQITQLVDSGKGMERNRREIR